MERSTYALQESIFRSFTCNIFTFDLLYSASKVDVNSSVDDNTLDTDA